MICSSCPVPSVVDLFGKQVYSRLHVVVKYSLSSLVLELRTRIWAATGMFQSIVAVRTTVVLGPTQQHYFPNSDVYIYIYIYNDIYIYI